MDLHGRVTVKRPEPAPRRADTTSAARTQIVVDGRTFARGGHVVLRPDRNRNAQDHLLDGPQRDDRADPHRLRRRRPPLRDRRRRPRPGPHARHRPVPVLQAHRGGGGRTVTPELEKQILVAGVGNAWLQDDALRRRVRAPAARPRACPSGRDGHGLRDGRARPRLRAHARLRRARAARRRRARAASPGRSTSSSRSSADFGGRDRGRRGHQPARHGPGDRAALRQRDRRLLGQGRRHRLRAGRGRRRRARAHAAGRGRGRARAGARAPRRSTSCGRTPPTRPDARVLDRARPSSTPRSSTPAAGRVTVVSLRVRAPAPGRARRRWRSLRHRRARDASARARGSTRRSSRRGCAATACARDVGDRGPGVPLPDAAGRADVDVLSGEELEVESIEVGARRRMHRVKVRVVEDALDANNTIARANRDDFDRHGVTVREPDERAGRGQDDAARAGARRRPRRRARRRARGRRAGLPRRRPARAPARPRDAAQHRQRLRRRVPPRREHGPLGAARRCRSTTSTC